MKPSLPLTLALLLGLAPAALTGCKTDTAGVESSYLKQYANVNGDIEETAEAAEEVLSDMNLLEIDSRVTDVDAMVTAQKADGTEIEVSITPLIEGESSQIAVWVGTTGDPKMGKKIAREIKDEVEE